MSRSYINPEHGLEALNSAVTRLYITDEGDDDPGSALASV
jgi:hypothetical protein